MGEISKIEWTDGTVNWWEGCTKWGPGCDACYAEEQRANHYKTVEWGKGRARRRVKTALATARKLDRRARGEGRRLRVFTLSLGDFFDAEVDPSWRDDAWDHMRKLDALQWLVLTKRTENIAGMLPDDWGSGWPHVMLGMSAGRQQELERRQAELFDVPSAGGRFLSYEPAIGPLNLRSVRIAGGVTCLLGGWYGECLPDQRFTWVIAGAESGAGRREADPDWFRAMRDQCVETETPFLLKQMFVDGKKSSLPELDGQRWAQFPELAPVAPAAQDGS